MRITSTQAALSSETPMGGIESSRFSARQSELNLTNENALSIESQRHASTHQLIARKRIRVAVSCCGHFAVGPEQVRRPTGEPSRIRHYRADGNYRRGIDSGTIREIGARDFAKIWRTISRAQPAQRSP